MRLIYCSFILLVSAISPNAHAASNGDLYKHCKKFADKSFQMENLTDVMCVTYFRAIADSGFSICDVWGKIAGDVEKGVKRTTMNIVKRSEGVGKVTNVEPAIQIYVNKMAKKPESWEYRADYQVLSSLQQLSPCE